jgi:PAS domain S-box-containing protein
VTKRRTITEYVSAQGRVEAELRESERSYRALFESAGDAIIVLDDNRCIDCNQAAPEMFGRSREELVGCSPDELSPRFQPDGTVSAEKVREKLIEALQGDAQKFEWLHVRPDGTFFDVEINLKVVELSTGPRFLAIVRDITAQKQTEEQLRDYQAELQALAAKLSSAEEEERRHLATELHDQIGQTLAVAKMKLGALGKLVNCNECHALVADLGRLLDQTIAGTRSLTFQLSPPLLHEMGFESAAEWLAEQMREQHGLEVELTADPAGERLKGDLAALLFRSLRELLLNVVKHAGAGRAQVAITRREGHLEVRVHDDGYGFDPEPDAAVKKDPGGFGLFSIRERLDHLGGRLEVGNSPDGGAEVVMVVPLGPLCESECK